MVKIIFDSLIYKIVVLEKEKRLENIGFVERFL